MSNSFIFIFYGFFINIFTFIIFYGYVGGWYDFMVILFTE